MSQKSGIVYISTTPPKWAGQAAQYDNPLIIKCQAEPVCLCNQAGGVEACINL